MTILLEPFTLPERGPVTIQLNQTFEIKVTAEEARRKVHLWLLDEVSCQMGAEPPVLVVGERAVWRVSTHLSAPHIGLVGTVGMVDIDVQTGEMANSSDCKAAIKRRARELAAKLPPYQPLQSVSDQYIPQHIPPAPVLTLPDDEPLPVIA